MRKYPPRAGAHHRTLYGIALIAGLEQFEATRPLAAGFRTLNDALIALLLEKPPLLTALTVARAGVRVGDYQFDRVVRQIDRACQLADGGARGPVFRAVFPDHVSCVVSPTGVGQVAAGDAFVRRLEAAGVEGVAARTEDAPFGPQGGRDGAGRGRREAGVAPGAGGGAVRGPRTGAGGRDGPGADTVSAAAGSVERHLPPLRRSP